CRTGKRHPDIVVSLVSELPKLVPAADFQRRRKVGIVLAAVASKLQLTDHERWVTHTKIEPVTIAGVGLARTRSRRITVKNRKQKRRVFGKLVFYARADGGQWISRSTARQIDRGDRRPIALQKDLTEIAVEELSVRGELAKPDADRSDPALEPQFGKSDRGCGFDRRNCVHASDIVTADAAIIVDSERIGVEAPVLPSGKFFEIDQKLALQLALDDCAGSNAAGRVAQHIIGGDQIVRDAAIAEPFAVPVEISVI